jgi:peptidoglycan/LPS O-acetylase OafA/YrhL
MHGGATSHLVTGILSLGLYGVEVFFFLSGWLLASIYGVSRNSISKNYWTRRFVRIVPLWMLFLLVQVVMSRIFGEGGWLEAKKIMPGQQPSLHSSVGIFFLTATFMLWISASLWNSVIPGGWSIQAEVGHYLLFPILRKLSFSKIILFISLSNFFASAIYFFTTLSSQIHIPQILFQFIEAWIRLSLFASINYFLVGIFCFCIFNLVKQSSSPIQSLKHLEIPKPLILFYLLTFLIIPLPFGSQIQSIGYVFIILVASTLISSSSLIGRIFSTLGKYSYFIYFAHFQILFLVLNLTKKLKINLSFPLAQPAIFVLLFLSTCLISTLLAIPSFRFFEGPFIKLAHKSKG